MDQYNGNAAAVWPPGISLPDDADIAKGISAIDPAFEALADRTAILKGKLNPRRIVQEYNGVCQSNSAPVPPLDSNWATVLTYARMQGDLNFATAQKDDLVKFIVEFKFSVSVQFNAVRVAYTLGTSGVWNPVPNALTYALTSDYAGPATLIGCFSPVATGESTFDLALQCNNNGATTNLFGPINWHCRIERPNA